MKYWVNDLHEITASNNGVKQLCMDMQKICKEKNNGDIL